MWQEKILHPFNCIVLLLKGVTSRNRKDFLKALSLVKNKDPRIYDKKVELYKEGIIYVSKFIKGLKFNFNNNRLVN